jgi:hypothetical protein
MGRSPFHIVCVRHQTEKGCRDSQAVIVSWAQPFPRTWKLRPSGNILHNAPRFVNEPGRLINYGLGWEMDEKHGLRWFGHGGGSAGVAAMLSVYPDADLVSTRALGPEDAGDEG